MRNRRKIRRILVVALLVFAALSAAQAVVTTETGPLAGLLFMAAVGFACYRVGCRPAPGRATQARRPQAARPPARRRRPLRARIARDTARLLISRR